MPRVLDSIVAGPWLSRESACFANLRRASFCHQMALTASGSPLLWPQVERCLPCIRARRRVPGWRQWSLAMPCVRAFSILLPWAVAITVRALSGTVARLAASRIHRINRRHLGEFHKPRRNHADRMGHSVSLFSGLGGNILSSIPILLSSSSGSRGFQIGSRGSSHILNPAAPSSLSSQSLCRAQAGLFLAPRSPT